MYPFQSGCRVGGGSAGPAVNFVPLGTVDGSRDLVAIKADFHGVKEPTKLLFFCVGAHESLNETGCTGLGADLQRCR